MQLLLINDRDLFFNPLAYLRIANAVTNKDEKTLEKTKYFKDVLKENLGMKNVEFCIH